MSTLIHRERARQAVAQTSLDADEQQTLDQIVEAVSDAIERICGREFSATTYDEVHDGWGQEALRLEHYPLLAIERIAYNPTSVLRIQNTSSSNQRAYVEVTSEGLKLTRIASGIPRSDESVTFAANVTLTAMAAAVDALGSGWDASLPDSTYALYPSDELIPSQGALACLTTYATLEMCKDELAQFDAMPDSGLIYRKGDPGLAESVWTPTAETSGAGFGGGRRYWRVRYAAGFRTVPAAVQEACAEWAAALYWATKENPAVLGDLTPTRHVLALIEPYRAVGGR